MTSWRSNNSFWVSRRAVASLIFDEILDSITRSRQSLERTRTRTAPPLPLLLALPSKSCSMQLENDWPACRFHFDRNRHEDWIDDRGGVTDVASALDLVKVKKASHLAVYVLPRMISDSRHHSAVGSSSVTQVSMWYGTPPYSTRTAVTYIEYFIKRHEMRTSHANQ